MAKSAAKQNGRATDDMDRDAIASRVKSQVDAGVEQAQEAFDQVATQASEEFRKVSDQSVKFVRENPGMAVAGALGIGVLIGLALRNRD